MSLLVYAESTQTILTASFHQRFLLKSLKQLCPMEQL